MDFSSDLYGPKNNELSLVGGTFIDNRDLELHFE